MEQDEKRRQTVTAANYGLPKPYLEDKQ
jgi:hypothetical protein